uniref:Uncharacterized protein n=1 Tax=Arundo donax TaxID=35708 RepID=A0A0A9FMT0_ARUDO
MLSVSKNEIFQYHNIKYIYSIFCNRQYVKAIYHGTYLCICP